MPQETSNKLLLALQESKKILSTLFVKVLNVVDKNKISFFLEDYMRLAEIILEDNF